MRFALWLALLCCSCGSLRSSGIVAGGGALGAGVGLTVAGPVGAIAGAGIGSGLTHGLRENSELRSGELVGAEAHERAVVRAQGRPATLSDRIRWRLQSIVWWLVAIPLGLWLLRAIVTPRGREHGRGLISSLLHLDIRGAITSLLKAGGWMHSRKARAHA